MLLTEIRDYVALRGRVSLTQIAQQFAISDTYAQSLLDIWLRKGIIKESEETLPACHDKCSTCSECNTGTSTPKTMRYYYWSVPNNNN